MRSKTSNTEKFAISVAASFILAATTGIPLVFAQELNGYNNSAGSDSESIAPPTVYRSPANQSPTNDIAANSVKGPALSIKINALPPESENISQVPTPMGTPGRHPNLRPDIPID
jgi:hypothetical protein